MNPSHPGPSANSGAGPPNPLLQAAVETVARLRDEAAGPPMTPEQITAEQQRLAAVQAERETLTEAEIRDFGIAEDVDQVLEVWAADEVGSQLDTDMEDAVVEDLKDSDMNDTPASRPAPSTGETSSDGPPAKRVFLHLPDDPDFIRRYIRESEEDQRMERELRLDIEVELMIERWYGGRFYELAPSLQERLRKK